MPGARLEVAELLVLHQIHLGEELDADIVGIAVMAATLWPIMWRPGPHTR